MFLDKSACTTPTKRCAKCGSTKPHDAFPNRASSADGKYSYCKSCAQADNRRRYYAKREDILRRERERRAADPEGRARANARAAERYRADPGAARARARRWAEQHPVEHATRKARDSAKSRAKLDALKAHPCVDCNVQYPPAVMQFDHVRGVKSYNIGVGAMRKPTLEDELAKCELRCANCHAIRHASERATNRSL
jgi:hypothetical protein